MFQTGNTFFVGEFGRLTPILITRQTKRIKEKQFSSFVKKEKRKDFLLGLFNGEVEYRMQYTMISQP